MKELTVKSPAFQPNSPIPKKYSCDGEEMNPPITIEGVPKDSQLFQNVPNYSDLIFCNENMIKEVDRKT